MIHVLLLIIIASIITTLPALLGFFLISRIQDNHHIILLLASFSAGALLGVTFFDLIPEGLENSKINLIAFILIGIIVFFLLEKVLRWHHLHDKDCDFKPIGYLTLFGDLIHNFIDGIILAAAFLVNIGLGLTVMVSIVFHEVPQELSDYSLMLYSGFTKKKALYFNFLVALSSIAGAIIYYFFSSIISISSELMLFAAGSFLYMSLSDLIPELHKEESLTESLKHVFLLLLGITVIYVFNALI